MASGATSGKKIDIKALIDERPISAYPWLLVALCFLIVAADGMGRFGGIFGAAIGGALLGFGWRFGARISHASSLKSLL